MSKHIHIGKKIKEIVVQSRLKKTEFADLINISRTVVYDIFKRETIDTALLQTISKVLDHDFFGYYNSKLHAKENKENYSYATKAELSEVVDSIKQLSKKIDELKEIIPKGKTATPKSNKGKKQ
jgi:transcriptional regulator with XRE-family HTH domain